jgi:hypothetical protein
MAGDDATELVDPTQIRAGDEIEDQLGQRWLTVSDIRLLSAADGGTYSFYGTGPDDRMSFDGHEQVRRRRRS